jgi:hypothetical protein
MQFIKFQAAFLALLGAVSAQNAIFQPFESTTVNAGLREFRGILIVGSTLLITWNNDTGSFVSVSLGNVTDDNDVTVLHVISGQTPNNGVFSAGDRD